MRKYGRKAQKKVGRAMHEFKEGKLKSGRSGKKVKNPKQAVAIGLSEARKEGGKVPKRKKKASTRKKSASKKKTGAKKKSAGKRKTTTRKKTVRRKTTRRSSRSRARK